MEKALKFAEGANIYNKYVKGFNNIFELIME